jgi:hypothetical protein
MNSKVYFGKDEEAYISQYNSDKISSKMKEKIYVEKIHPLFLKLSENILNTYGKQHQFFNIGYESDELILMGATFAYTVLDKYNPAKGKAYSFFGTVIKRYFIQLSMKAQRNKINHVDLDDVNSFINEYHDGLIHTDEYFNEVYDEGFINDIKVWFLDNHNVIDIRDKDEIKIMKAILDLIDFSQYIENINKKALYIYIKEISRVEKSYKITNTIRKMKSAFFILKENYIATNGNIVTGSIIIKK